jgi:hypothetical protein
LTINPVVPITPTTIKITPRQAAVERATLRREALLSTAAASQFHRAAAKAAPAAATLAAQTTNARDAAIAALAGQTAR